MSALHETSAPPTGGERITVALTKRVKGELDELRDSAEMSKTDVVNRAISLYRLVETQRQEGRTLAFVGPDADEVRRVELL